MYQIHLRRKQKITDNFFGNDVAKLLHNIGFLLDCLERH
jgi:hypothetical protein